MITFLSAHLSLTPHPTPHTPLQNGEQFLGPLRWRRLHQRSADNIRFLLTKILSNKQRPCFKFFLKNLCNKCLSLDGLNLVCNAFWKESTCDRPGEFLLKTPLKHNSPHRPYEETGAPSLAHSHHSGTRPRYLFPHSAVPLKLITVSWMGTGSL